MISQILLFKPFNFFMLFDSKIRPFFMNNISQNCKFFGLTNYVRLPVISQFISRLLSHHPTLYPFFTPTHFLPIFTTSVNRFLWIRNILYALITYLGQPKFYRLGLR